MPTSSSSPVDYDRLAELKAFDDTRRGVQGLVASGVSKVPRIFVLQPEDRVKKHENGGPHPCSSQIPVIDLSGRREGVVEGIRRASKLWGFFQVVGHAVPVSAMTAAIEAVRAFNEGADSADVKEALYSRDPERAVKYQSNFDLYHGRVANWRDTLFYRMAPNPPSPEEMPESCRDELFEYAKHVKMLGDTLFGFLSEALGLKSTYLEDIECNQAQILVSHYYPPCPEPDMVIGTSQHSDPGFLTVLLQDQIGGLQVLHEDQWVDVSPIPGALVINIADLLQLISNDRFTSVEHRVLARSEGARISIACFFRSHPSSTRLYGPIEELVSYESPPLYKEILASDYITYYYSIGLDGKSAIEHFRL